MYVVERTGVYLTFGAGIIVARTCYTLRLIWVERQPERARYTVVRRPEAGLLKSHLPKQSCRECNGARNEVKRVQYSDLFFASSKDHRSIVVFLFWLPIRHSFRVDLKTPLLKFWN